MKKFNLKKAKEGADLLSVNGKEAKIIYYNRSSNQFPLVVILNNMDVKFYTEEGKYYTDKDSEFDLRLK